MDDPLRTLRKYVQRSREMQSFNPTVAYFALLFSVEKALPMAGKTAPAELRRTVNEWMSTLESLQKKMSDHVKETIRKQHTDGEEYTPTKEDEKQQQRMIVEDHALEVFRRADDAERGGKLDDATMKKYFAAVQFMDICQIFGDLSEDVREKRKYAMWRIKELREFMTNQPPQGNKQPQNPAPPAASSNSGGGSPPLAASTEHHEDAAEKPPAMPAAPTSADESDAEVPQDSTPSAKPPPPVALPKPDVHTHASNGSSTPSVPPNVHTTPAAGAKPPTSSSGHSAASHPTAHAPTGHTSTGHTSTVHSSAAHVSATHGSDDDKPKPRSNIQDRMSSIRLMGEAETQARHAASALQFQDKETAVKHLKKALKILESV